MIVFRTICKDFLSQYENHKKVEGSNINGILNGREYGISYNNHNYCYNVKYIHFFKDLIDTIDLKKQRFEEKKEECLILAFDIPAKILKTFEGRGGYDFDSKTVTAIEYAIPEKEYDPKWFLSVVDETEQKQVERVKVDYSKISFGFHSQTNEEIDSYIKQHTLIENPKDGSENT